MRLPSTSVAALALGLASSASGALETGAGYELDYARRPGTESCPPADSLAAEVASLVGRNPFAPGASRRIRVELLAQPRGEKSAVIQLFGPDEVLEGRQVLISRGSDCVALAQSVVLAISIALESLSSPASAAEAPGELPAVTRESSLPQGRSAWSLELQVGPVVTAGLSPSPAPGLSGGLAVRRGRVSLGLEADWTLAEGKDVPGGSVSAQLLALSLVPCFRFTGLLGACLSLTAGAVAGSARNLSGAHDNATAYVGAGGRAFLSFPLARGLSLRPTLEVEVPIVRTLLAVDDTGVWKTSWIAGTLGLQLAAEVP